jgi:hypothetical protein
VTTSRLAALWTSIRELSTTPLDFLTRHMPLSAWRGSSAGAQPYLCTVWVSLSIADGSLIVCTSGAIVGRGLVLFTVRVDFVLSGPERLEAAWHPGTYLSQSFVAELPITELSASMTQRPLKTENPSNPRRSSNHDRSEHMIR